MKVQQALDELKHQVDELAALIEQGEQEAKDAQEIRLLARIVAARGALGLAAELLHAHPHEVTGPIMDSIKALAEQVAEWREDGAGWFEERWITREKLFFGKNEETGEVEAYTQPRTYGPYYYYRWRDKSGKMRMVYYGRTDPRTAVGSEHTTEEKEGARLVTIFPTPKSRKAHLAHPGEPVTLCGQEITEPGGAGLAFRQEDCQRCRKLAEGQGLAIPGE